MKSETAKVLVETISHALGIAVDNRNKITALESLIHDKNPALFQEYTECLERVRKHPQPKFSFQVLKRFTQS